MKTNEDIHRFEVRLSHHTPEIGSYWEGKWFFSEQEQRVPRSIFLILGPAQQDNHFYCLNYKGKIEIRGLGTIMSGYGPCK